MRGGKDASPALTDQLVGSLLGQALGDALGFVVEAQPPEVARDYVHNWLRTGRAAERSAPHFPFGQYTDDTLFKACFPFLLLLLQTLYIFRVLFHPILLVL